MTRSCGVQKAPKVGGRTLLGVDWAEDLSNQDDRTNQEYKMCQLDLNAGPSVSLGTFTTWFAPTITWIATSLIISARTN